MPINFGINKEDGFVHTNAHGIVTELELLGYLETLLADAALPRPIRDLHDLSRVSSFQITPKTIRRILDLAQLDLARVSNGRVAVIAPNDFEFGMSRMFEMLAGGAPAFDQLRTKGLNPEIAVFRDEAAAKEWLLSFLAAHDASYAVNFSQRRA